MKQKFYIAAPFFNEKQVKIVEGIEEILSANGFDYFSPRKEGVLIDVPPEERAQHTQRIYDSNINNIEDCDCMIAVVDGRDIGTIFEIGYFTALKKNWGYDGDGNEITRRLITFTDENFGLNVMIQKSVDAHMFGHSSLIEFLALCKYNLKMTDDELSLYRNFNEKVY